MGFIFDSENEEMTIWMHYSNKYTSSVPTPLLEKAITKDILYYLFLLSKTNTNRFDDRQLYLSGGEYIESTFSGEEPWVAIQKK